MENKSCTVADCERIVINYLYPEVGRITNFCEMFLANHTYSDIDNNTNNLCVLLLMEVIFEEFAFGFFEKYVKGQGLQHLYLIFKVD